MTYLRLITTNFRGRTWDYVSAPERLVVVPTWTQTGRLVAISQRRPTSLQRVISPPMGTTTLRSGVKQARFAEMEVKAETGHSMLTIKHVLTAARSSGMTDESVDFYVAIAASNSEPQALHDDEDIEVLLLDAQNARNFFHMPPAGHIVDASFMAYLAFQQEARSMIESVKADD